MKEGQMKTLLLGLGALVLPLLVIWGDPSTGYVLPAILGLVAMALFFATYPRGHRARPGLLLAGAVACFYFLVIGAPTGSMSRSIGGIGFFVLAVLAVGPDVFSTFKALNQARTFARSQAREALTRFKQQG